MAYIVMAYIVMAYLRSVATVRARSWCANMTCTCAHTCPYACIYLYPNAWLYTGLYTCSDTCPRMCPYTRLYTLYAHRQVLLKPNFKLLVTSDVKVKNGVDVIEMVERIDEVFVF